MVPHSGVRRKYPRGGPKHRRSQGSAKGAMPPHKFVENIVILCFERRFSKQNSAIRLKLNILVYTAEYWQYTSPKTVYTLFIFKVWGEGHGTVATPFRTLVVAQFAYWSIGSFLHPYESHLPFTPVLTTRMIRALPRCHCRIYIADTQTVLQALSLLGAYNTRNEFFASSLETRALCEHFQWLRKKFISNLAYLKSY